MTIEQANFLKHVTSDQGNHQKCDIHENYSGRGMFGRETVGIVVDSIPQLLTDVLNWVNDSVFDDSGNGGSSSEWNGGAVPKFDNLILYDNMGRSMILY